MRNVSACISNDIEAELDAYIEETNLDKNTAVRELLERGLDEWFREDAIETLEADEATFSSAAEIADMNVWDFAVLAKNEKATWVSDDHLESDLEDL